MFRAAPLDGTTLRSGEEFQFDLYVFDTGDPSPGLFISTFAALAQEGLGPTHGRATLTSAWQLGPDRRPAACLYRDGMLLVEQVPEPLRLALDASIRPVRRATVRFVTPTELKTGETLAARPEFGVLYSRARDRVSTLGALYGGGPLNIDFSEAGARAWRVKLLGCDLRYEHVQRRSSRTGQVHPLGGFVGTADYEGDLTEFLPVLQAACWTGVGRQTVWGKGQIELLF